MLRYLVFFGIGFMLSGCTSNDEEKSENSIDDTIYFPLQRNIVDYKVSQVDIYNDGSTRDSFNYYLRESVSSSYIDSNEEEISVIDQYTKLSISDSWQLVGRVTSHIANNQVIRKEENISQIKLVLPPMTDDTWNPNAFFDDNVLIPIGSGELSYYSNWQSIYTDLNMSTEVNGMEFTNVIAVTLANYENRLQYRHAIEYYAPDIGLIYKEIHVFDTQCFDSCSDIAWPDKANIGQVFIQSIVDFSHG